MNTPIIPIRGNVKLFQCHLCLKLFTKRWRLMLHRFFWGDACVHDRNRL